MHMLTKDLAVFVLLYVVVFHVLGGMIHHKHRQRRGLRPNVYWSMGRGIWGSVNVDGFRIGHKLSLKPLVVMAVALFVVVAAVIR
jgi:hypothetical protein